MQTIEDIESVWSLESGSIRNINVLASEYTYENWNGSAFVLYEEGGKLYVVHGSHCSCYGLEGQWDPEETTVEEIEHQLENGYIYNGYQTEIREALSKFNKGKRVKRVLYFEASDGTRFDDENECLNYEQICELENGIRSVSGLDNFHCNEIARWFVETYTFEAK